MFGLAIIMPSKLEHAMSEVSEKIVELHQMTMHHFNESIKAFEDLDQERAENVQNLSAQPEDLHHMIEDIIFGAIVKHSPEDADLRKLVAYLYTSISLKRLGRYARKISETVNLCDGLDHFKELESIPYLSEIAAAALDISLKSVLEGDLSEIDSLEKLEAQSDHEITCMFEEITEFLQARRDISTLAMCYVIVGRYCERAADEAINIAEAAVYMVKGVREKLGQVYKDADEDEYLS